MHHHHLPFIFTNKHPRQSSEPLTSCDLISRVCTRTFSLRIQSLHVGLFLRIPKYEHLANSLIKGRMRVYTLRLTQAPTHWPFKLLPKFSQCIQNANLRLRCHRPASCNLCELLTLCNQFISALFHLWMGVGISWFNSNFWCHNPIQNQFPIQNRSLIEKIQWGCFYALTPVLCAKSLTCVLCPLNCNMKHNWQLS